MRDAETARIAAEAGADAIGLVFIDGSPRRVTPDQAAHIVAAIPAFVEPVALFVDAPIAEMKTIATGLGVRTIQLHGREQIEDARELAPLHVIKALPFEPESLGATIEWWRRECTNLAGVLVDHPVAADARPAERGGQGETIDWTSLSRLRRADHAPCLVLAGGLDPTNVGEAIATARPDAVDVSSGVERERGVKDSELIRSFCRAVVESDQAMRRASSSFRTE